MIQGLIGHWDLNGNAKDRTPFGNDGTVTGATLTTDRFGVADRGYSFDGTDDVIVTTNSLNLSEIKTVSFWARSDNVTLQNRNCVALRAGSGGGNTLYFGYAINSNQVGIFNGSTIINFGISPVVNVWHHFVFVINGTDANVIIDGVARTPASIGTINSVTSPVTIGANSTQSFFFDGKISDVKIFNRALSDAEITSIYKEYNPNYRLNSLAQGLVGHWDMNGNAKDKTPYGNDGVVTGATLTTDIYGQANKAYSFDGVRTNSPLSLNHNITTAIVDNTPFLNGFTVSAWVLPNANTANMRVVNKSSSNTSTSNSGFSFTVTSNNRYTLSVHGTGVATPNNTLVVGVWQYMTAVVRNDAGVARVRWYKNGVAVGNEGATGNFSNFTTTNPVVIGNSSANDRTWDGLISDVRLYNRVLSATEVSTIYKNY